MKTRISVTWILGLVLLASFSIAGAQQTQPALTNASPQAAITAKTYESPWVGELAKLGQAGVQDQVLFAFIDSAGTFNLNPEQIIRLRDQGVSNDAINAALQHDAEIALGLRQVPASTVPGNGVLPSLLVKSEGKASTAEPSAANTNKVEAVPAPIPVSMDLADNEDSGPGAEPAQWVNTSVGPAEVSPVRKPYAEPITCPIVVYRASGRVPNVVTIEMFP